MDDPNLSPAKRNLLLIISKFPYGICRLANSELAEMMGISVKYITNLTRELRKDGYIRAYSEGMGTDYRIVKEIINAHKYVGSIRGVLGSADKRKQPSSKRLHGASAPSGMEIQLNNIRYYIHIHGRIHTCVRKENNARKKYTRKYKERKNQKRKSAEGPASQDPLYDSDYFKFARRITIRKWKPWLDKASGPLTLELTKSDRLHIRLDAKLQKTAAHYVKLAHVFRLLVERDGYEWDEVKDMMKWALTNDYWNSWEYSYAQLRAKSRDGEHTRFYHLSKQWAIAKKESEPIKFGYEDDRIEKLLFSLLPENTSRIDQKKIRDGLKTIEAHAQKNICHLHEITDGGSGFCGTPESVIVKYLQWLEGEHWIEDVSHTAFKVTAGLYRSFIKQLGENMFNRKIKI